MRRRPTILPMHRWLGAASELAPHFDLMRFVRQSLNDEKPDLYRLVNQEVDRLVLQEVMQHCMAQTSFRRPNA